MNSHEHHGTQIDESMIDKLGHVVAVPLIEEGTYGYNDRIDVFSSLNEGDRAQIYQAWALIKFTENPVAMAGFERFGLAGESDTKENWTQLLEHIAGVTAIVNHLETLMERHGASKIDMETLDAASVFDNMQKPDALETAVYMHDLEKRAEVEMSGGGGLENSLDNPVLRDGALWRWLADQGVSQKVIEAAQNTGREDRLYSDYGDYDEAHIKKAVMQREKLAQTLGVSIDAIDQMTATERRYASIVAKGRLAAMVGFGDAMARQFRLQGFSEASIDAMGAHYLTYKNDAESIVFFRQDFPEYFKQVRRFLIEQIPEPSRPVFEAELDAVTHEDMFNQTILPGVLGDKNPIAREVLKY